MIEITEVKLSRPRQRITDPILLTVRMASMEDNQYLRVKVYYVGSPDYDKYDQVICDEEIDEIPKGVVEFELECSPPDVLKIPKDSLLGVTSLIVSFTGREEKRKGGEKEKKKEFTRVGYFVRVEYPGIEIIEDEDSEDQEDIEDEEFDGLEDSVEEEDTLRISAEEPFSLSGESLEDLKVEVDVPSFGRVTRGQMENISLDTSKIEIEFVEPPIIRVFTDVWQKEDLDL